MKEMILIYNNRTGIAEKIAPFLLTEGLNYRAVCSHPELREFLRHEEIALMVVDAELDENGMGEDIELIITTRRESNVPLLVISKQQAINAKIMMLEAGADDYVTMEASVLEILARIKAQIRHYHQLRDRGLTETRVLQSGGLVLDEGLHKVTVEGRDVKLTPIEYDILHLLLANQGRVFSNDQIYEKIWKMNPIGTDNTIAVHIRHLRKKIEKEPQKPRYIQIVWGQGYHIG